MQAKASDTACTLCFDGGWPYAAHRVIRNRTLQQWEEAGCPPRGSRPGEGDVVASYRSGTKVLRYNDAPALDSMTGNVMDCCLYAGLGTEKIGDIPNAKALVHRLWDECRSAG